MTFQDGFLALGVGTRLAKVGAALDHARFAALLAAAHGRPVAASALRHVQRALEKKQDGNVTLALIHLALSGVAILRDANEGARRMFLADALMRQGVEPFVIVKGLGFDPTLPDGALGKYNPDQPRVPAGNPDGGQWISGDWVEASNSLLPRPPNRIQVADASATRGREVRSGATPITEAAYQGTYHDFLRDQFANTLRNAGNTVLTEVPLLLPGDPPILAKVDILFRTIYGVVYAIEVKTGEDPSFTPQQRIVYPHVEVGNIVVSPDPRLPALALTPGAPLDRIEMVVMKTAGPGAPIQFVPLSRYMSE